LTTQAPQHSLARSTGRDGVTSEQGGDAVGVDHWLLLIGGIAVPQAGIDNSLDVAVTTTAGFTTPALLGVDELTFGLVLLHSPRRAG